MLSRQTALVPLLGSFAPRAGLVALRQTFVRRRQNCGAYTDLLRKELRTQVLRGEETIGPAPGRLAVSNPAFWARGQRRQRRGRDCGRKEGRRFISQGRVISHSAWARIVTKRADGGMWCGVSTLPAQRPP
jgi:hypothetical protein